MQSKSFSHNLTHHDNSAHKYINIAVIVIDDDVQLASL